MAHVCLVFRAVINIVMLTIKFGFLAVVLLLIDYNYIVQGGLVYAKIN